MRKSIRILLARQKLKLKKVDPKSRDKERRRLKVLQVVELLRRENMAAA